MALPLPLPGPPTRTPGLPASRRPGPAGFLLQTVTTDVTVKFLTVQFETVVKINGAVIFTTHVLNVLSVYIRFENFSTKIVSAAAAGTTSRVAGTRPRSCSPSSSRPSGRTCAASRAFQHFDQRTPSDTRNSTFEPRWKIPRDLFVTYQKK